MAETTRQRVQHFVAECYRVRWMLVAIACVFAIRAWHLLPDTSPVLLPLYKLANAALAFVVAHAAYQHAFPYLEMRTMVRRLEGERPSLADSWLFFGTTVLRGLIYLAFILGVTLGL